MTDDRPADRPDPAPDPAGSAPPAVALLPGEVPPVAVAPARPWRTQARTRILRLATRTPHQRLAAWRSGQRRGAVPALLDAADRAVRSGPIRISGGPAAGNVLPAWLLTVDHAQAGLLVRGTVEPPVAEALRRHLPAGGAFWDVGANAGYFTLLGARLAAAGGQVLAIDPVPAHARAVAEAIALNAAGEAPGAAAEVRVLQLAAWRERTPIDLVLPGDGAWAHLAATVDGPSPGTRLRVQAIALDGLLERPGVRPPDVIKIDVEGAELGVLDGLERTVVDHRPVLLVETHDTGHEVSAWAERHGYRVENLDRPGPLAAQGGQLAALVPAASPG